MRRLPLVLAATAALTTLVASPALAHTTANPTTTAAGAYAVIDFRVPHGCDGEATMQLDVQVPAGVVSVKPEDVPGWTATAEIGTYDEPVTLHGEEITEGVVSVTWVADDGEELADAQYRDFGMSVKFPDAAGETLYFPAVQTCPGGAEAAWIEIPDEDGEELDHPAPAITLTAAEGVHHGGDEADAEQAEEAVDDAELAAATAPADDGTDPLVWIALLVGVLGLAAGGAGLIVARRS